MRMLMIFCTGFLIGVIVPGDITQATWWFTIIPANIVNAGLWNVLIPND